MLEAWVTVFINVEKNTGSVGSSTLHLCCLHFTVLSNADRMSHRISQQKTNQCIYLLNSSLKKNASQSSTCTPAQFVLFQWNKWKEIIRNHRCFLTWLRLELFREQLLVGVEDTSIRDDDRGMYMYFLLTLHNTHTWSRKKSKHSESSANWCERVHITRGNHTHHKLPWHHSIRHGWPELWPEQRPLPSQWWESYDRQFHWRHL